MPELLPLFPLQLVAFPEERLNLHIFEPRYKQLVNECQERGITFGIPAYIEDEVMDIGTEMRLIEVQKTYDNGEMDIKTEGIGIFRLNEFYRVAPTKLYAGGEIERLTIQHDCDVLTNIDIINLVRELFSLLRINKSIPDDPEEAITYRLAHHVGLSMEQEYELLKIPTEIGRQAYMRSHLERLIPVVKEMENLRKRVQANGHFKNVIPPKV